MKTIIKSIAVLFGVVSLSSCESWLDVTSSNEIRSEEHLSSEMGFQQVVAGCYISMTSEELYGGAFSFQAPERMTDIYVKMISGSSDPCYYLQNHNFTSSYSTALIDAGWLAAYNVIANANSALDVIDEKQDMFDPINYAVIKGELLAIRAYNHFDILRLFSSGNLGERPEKLTAFTAPYVTTLSKDLTQQPTYAEFLSSLEADLLEASELLEEYDPITGKYDDSFYSSVNEDGFYDQRQQRLNYFAVQGLLARVYMWEGTTDSRAKALAITTSLIQDIEASSYVSWATDETLNTDFVMSTEHIFSLNVDDMIDKTEDYFAIAYIGEDPNAIYLMSAALADSTYEITSSLASTDYRFTKLMYYNVDNGYYMAKKLYQPNSSYYYKDLMPMLRMSEIYYMAAECLSDSNLDSAVTMLNEMRRRRGIITDLETTDIDTFYAELKKEYRKEFVGEGVLFYYYKRTGVESYMNYKDDEGLDIVMDDSRYVLPFPYVEFQCGLVQE